MVEWHCISVRVVRSCLRGAYGCNFYIVWFEFDVASNEMCWCRVWVGSRVPRLELRARTADSVGFVTNTKSLKNSVNCAQQRSQKVSDTLSFVFSGDFLAKVEEQSCQRGCKRWPQTLLAFCWLLMSKQSRTQWSNGLTRPLRINCPAELNCKS